MKATKIIIFLLLLQVAALAQLRPPSGPVTLRYRQGNTNTLNLIVSSAGQVITPSGSTTLTAEIRQSEAAKPLVTLPLLAAPGGSDYLLAALPDLAPNRYVLAIRINQAGIVQRAGICYLEILPSGSLITIPDATGLNVTLDMRSQVLDIKLDSGPTVAIVQSYAREALAARDSILASNLLTPSALTPLNTAVLSLSGSVATLQTSKLNLSTYQTDLANTVASLSQKLAISGFVSFTTSQGVRDQNQDNATSTAQTTASQALIIAQGNTTAISATNTDVANLKTGKLNVSDTSRFVGKLAGYRLMSPAEISKLAGLSKNYNDLDNRPTIPASASQVGAVSTVDYGQNRITDQQAVVTAQSAANAAQQTANANSAAIPLAQQIASYPSQLASIFQFYKKKTLRVLLSGTSIANNVNSAPKAFLTALQTKLGDSGNRTEALCLINGSYDAPHLNWKKQPYGGYKFTRLRGDNTAGALRFERYFSRYVLRFSKETDGGSFDVYLDGVFSQTVNCNGTQSYANEIVVNTALGLHTIELRAPGSGFSYLESQDFCQDKPGIHIMDASLGGSTLTQFVTARLPGGQQVAPIPIGGAVAGFTLPSNGITATLANTSATYKPDLIILTYTVNDAGAGAVAIADFYKPSLDYVLKKAAENGIAVVLVIEPGGLYSLPSDPNYANYNTVRNFMLSYQARYPGNLMVVDWQAKSGQVTSDYNELARLGNRHYSVQGLTPTSAQNQSYDKSSDFIHPNDALNAIGADMLFSATGLDPVGRQGDAPEVADDLSRAHSALVSAAAPSLFSPGWLGISSSYSLSTKNGLGLMNTYKTLSASVNLPTGNSEMGWQSETEINYAPELNDLVAAATTSDKFGRYRVYSSNSPYSAYVSLPTNSGRGSKFTVSLLVGPGRNGVSVRNQANTAFLPLSVQGAIYSPSAGLVIDNHLSEPQLVHVTYDTYQTDTPFFLVVSGQIYSFYVTLTDFACIPGKRYDQARQLVPSLYMSGDVAADRVIHGQLYAEAINGAVVEKIATAGIVYKPLATGNKWFGQYRLKPGSTAINSLLSLVGTLTAGPQNEQYGSATYTSNENPSTYQSATALVGSAHSGKTYTITGVATGDVVQIQLYNNLLNGRYSLQADGTWNYDGEVGNLAPNLIASTGTVGGKPLAFTFQLPSSAPFTNSNLNWIVWVKLRFGSLLIGNWHLCEGSSATN